MARRGIRLPVTGGMDLDSDSQFVSGTRMNYNIRSTGNSQGTALATEIILGNEEVFTVDPPEAQNKRIRFSDPPSGTFDLNVNYGNGLYTTISGVVWASFFTDVNAVLNPLGWTATSIVSTPTVIIAEFEYSDVGYPIIFQSDEVTIIDVLDPVPSSLVNPYYCIGSYDLLGNLFLFLTNKEEQKEVGNVLGITSTGSGEEEVTITNHGLSDGDVILLEGLLGVNGVNGVNYIVTVVDPDTVSIVVLYTGTYTGGGIAYTNVEGVDEIGVAVRNNQTLVWTYTMLLRGDLGFDRAYCIDVDGEHENNQYSLYYTDNLNKIRLFYYIGDFAFAGAFRYYDLSGRDQGLYFLNSLDQATSLIPIFSRGAIDFTRQDQSGGALNSGNYRYAYRLVSEGLANTEWTYLTNPISVFPPDDSGLHNTILGGADSGASYSTVKVNVLTVTLDENIPTLFKYIQFAYVHYAGDSFSGEILPVQLLIVGQEDYVLTHTGNEVGEELDTAALNTVVAHYDVCKNIRIVDNRLVISNIRSLYSGIDLSDYLSGATYELAKKTFGGGTVIGTTSYVNMYQKPENVFRYTGYMQHETYSFYGVPEFWNGQLGQPFHFQDVVFEATTGTTFNDWRISSAFSSGDVSVYVPYIKWAIPAAGFIVDGKKVSSFVRRVHVFRAERTRPSVLASGVIVCGVEGNVQDVVDATQINKIIKVSNVDNLLADVAGEFPFALGQSIPELQAGSAIAPLPYPSSGGAVANFTPLRQYLAFYFADDMLNYPTITDKTIDPVAGDEIFNHGAMDALFQEYAGTLPSLLMNYTLDASGVGTTDVIPAETLEVEDGTNARDAQFSVGAKTYSRTVKIVTNETTPFPTLLNSFFYHSPSLVVKVDADANPINGAAQDAGLYAAYYHRPVTNQYDHLTDQVVPTGAVVELNEQTATEVDVFGGDVYTQEVFLQERTVEMANNALYRSWGGGLRFFSQNTHNFQMRNDNNGANLQFPVGIGINDWLQSGYRQLFYQNGYDPYNRINIYRPFNPNVSYDEDLRATIAWSELKPQGSRVDNFRVFPPLNRKSEVIKFGEIVHMETVNGELFIIQVLKFIREFFNTTGVLTTSPGSQVSIGDGSVLQRYGVTISNYGGTHKWGITKGKSAGGNDVLYVPDAINQVIWRFGADGLVPISIRHKIHTWLKSNMTWVLDFDAPVADKGMTGVWNEEHKEYILTIRVRRNLDYAIWETGTEYALGTAVLHPSITRFNDFDLEGNRIFIAISSPNFDIIPGTDPAVWREVSLEDTEYYNLFTIVYSEQEDMFKCFLTPHPRLYLKWTSTYLTQSPYSLGFYLNNKGTYGVWWDDTTFSLEADGYVTPVMNWEPEVNKQLENIQIRSEVAPLRTEITSDGQYTYMDAFYDADEIGWQTPVTNDATVSGANPSGLNSVDTDAMWGTFAVVKIFLEKRVFQKIRSAILVIRTRFPNFK